MNKWYALRLGSGRASFCCSLLLSMSAVAADFTWTGASSGNWNETDANWSGAGTVWTNGADNNATFGASGTQNVTADAVTLNHLAFTADGYTLGGGPMQMNGSNTVTVGTGMSALLTATVTNTIGRWVKKGAGTLVLDTGVNQTNFFSTLRVSEGLLHITGGTHQIATNDANNINIGFDVNYGAMLVSGGKVRQASGGYSAVRGSLLITNGVVDLSASRELLNAFNGAGTTTVSGNGLLDVNTFRVSQTQGTASQNAINVNTGGVIRLNYFAIDTGANPKGMVNFNGGTLVAKIGAVDFLGTGAAQWLSGISARILEGGAVIDTGANGISIKQPLLSGAVSDGGLTKKGSGSLSLLTTNSFNGSTRLYGGTLNISRDQSLGAVPATPATNLLFMANSTLQSGGNHTVDVNRAFWITNAVTATFDTQAYTQMVYGTIMCAETSSTLVKAGSGMLVLDPGQTAVNRFGTLQTAAGTLVVASGTNLVTRANSGQNAPGLRISGGTMLVAGGVVKTTSLMFVNVDGGHLLVTNGLVDTTSCYEILNGIGSIYGYTTVSGSGVILANAVRISQNTGNPSNMVVSVNTGGVMRLNNFYIDTNFNGQKGMLFLNGGTVEARTDNVNFLGTTEVLVGNANDKWLTNIFVHVREGGAIFDTAGKNISIKQPLYTGAAVDGGMIKRGAGTLTLLNTNTYNGVTVVEGGTLKFGRNDLLPVANTAMASSNAVLDINGKTQTLAGLGGGGTVTNLTALTVTDTLAPGDASAFGTLTLAGQPASIAGCTLSVNVSTNGACDCLHVQGDLDLSTLSLSVENAAQLERFKRYKVATCTGTLTKPFNTVGALPLRWMVKYDTVNKFAYLVYDPGTLIRVQ